MTVRWGNSGKYWSGRDDEEMKNMREYFGQDRKKLHLSAEKDRRGDFEVGQRDRWSSVMTVVGSLVASLAEVGRIGSNHIGKWIVEEETPSIALIEIFDFELVFEWSWDVI